MVVWIGGLCSQLTELLLIKQEVVRLIGEPSLQGCVYRVLAAMSDEFLRISQSNFAELAANRLWLDRRLSISASTTIEATRILYQLDALVVELVLE